MLSAIFLLLLRFFLAKPEIYLRKYDMIPSRREIPGPEERLRLLRGFRGTGTPTSSTGVYLNSKIKADP
ncbi:hypothetical protein COT70_02315 [candidate division WWE3 bacterium CG09_land_8_20_14_0_10_47_33]|uniref:Uncharacterized protein n=1 Tax=candidate division WWE3 bacterium CG_4_9_14_0_2_um_filter_48_10 TaxID=1975078 RepID=A0A2M8EK78_UNCKA|nr:MAG: hypothetical protein COT70_02315 [candidate division WWE3 bacterium CG09_land_8_20_14_0_10_47_33]PIZ41603.1 MAG: hypothetical protein COY35_00055 [candidate division WWE3 bacterium CG_4_10_14_0_2_um_filter_47_8]PJC23108.1 MAG: hypothetical protein CO059_00675 [candidate division WWE3 bacterium CG_4_9_14_0_2_um_filter_48_10]PJE51951.1 MAG: hypothetical protein COV28_01400 [candidate division WWE3 bacterium CG10_big_fil_rev_8_21_14_0_10_48_23]